MTTPQSIRLTEIKLPLDHAHEAINAAVCERLKLKADDIQSVSIFRRGFDARKKPLRYGLENVTLLLWLLGTAEGDVEKVRALHGSRLRMMLEKTTDTTVRGVIYEGTGTVPADVLALGREEMAHAQRTNEIPYETLEADPRGDREAWLADVLGAIERLLAGPRRVAA